MLARFFQKSEPISFVSLLLVLFSFVIVHTTVSSTTQLGLDNISEVLGAFLFFTFLVFLVSFVVAKNHLTQVNYYAILFFVLLIGLFPSVLSISKISLSHFFVLLSARRLYSIHSKKQLLSKLFDSGFYIGIAFLLYPQTIVYVLPIYASYFIYIKIIDKNLLLPIIGFLTPVFVVFTYYFIQDKLAAFQTLIEINLNFELIKFSTQQLLLPLVLIAAILVFSLFKILFNAHSFDVSDKNSNKLVIAHLVISVLFLLLNNLRIEETIQYLFFPVAILAGNLFYLLKKDWIKDVILYGFLIVAFILPFLPNFN